MASQGGTPVPGSPFTQEQINQMLQAEATQRGMTLDQLKLFHRQQIMEGAAAAGISPPEYIERKRREAIGQHQRQQQMQQQQAQQAPVQGQPRTGQLQPQQQMQQQQIPMNGTVEAKPEALALAKFLRSQNLKTRTCILDGQRKDMFKVKRAFRALLSDTYKKARAKNPLLPEVSNDVQARAAVQMLPLSMLALRVSKADPHEGHNHAKPSKEKRVKGLWTVKVERQQEFEPMMHYIWLYEGSQWKTKVWAGLALIAVFAVVLFPLWPLMLRQGVWYLSVGCMGLLGLFFAMAIFRLILFVITMFATPPGLWLFPNLFEDVGFFDSFKPVWGWQETKKAKKSKKVIGGGESEKAPTLNDTGAANGTTIISVQQPSATSGALPSATTSAALTKRHATVEEVDDD